MENKKRRSKKRRLILLLIALFFTTVMFTTTTYAWFTANQTVKVDTLTVNVEAKNGIQISVDGTNWKSTILNGDITGASATYDASVNQLPASMEPVSTVGEIDTTGKMKMYYGTITSNAGGSYILTAQKETETRGTAGKFIAFDLFFKVTAQTQVYISKASGVKVASADDTGIKNASRIGFVVLGNADAGETVPNIQALGLNLTAEQAAAINKYIWEPNYDVHTAAAVAHARDTYGVTTSQTGGSQIPYSGVKDDIEATSNVLVQVENPTDYTTTFGSLFGTVNVTHATKAGAGFDANLALFTLQPGITKVRIYMWVEGQDVDCENNASGGSISYDLVITTLSE